MRPIVSRLVWDQEHADLVVDVVRGASVSVWIATANLKDVHVPPGRGRGRGRYVSMLEEFDALAARGVELRILHAGTPSRRFRDTFDRFARLCAGGLQLRQCPRVHLKAVIVDGRWLYLGSANWTGAGLGLKSPRRRNFEAGWVTSDFACIDEVQERFEDIWRGIPCRDCGLRAECEAPLDLPSADGRRTPGKTIVRLRPPAPSE
jgi:phosphatidylserine/phosphatidylglycerophosphate/cardiolipin synthase-like enzyme